VNLRVSPQKQGVVDRIIERMTQDDAFNQIDTSPEDLRQRFASLGVETAKSGVRSLGQILNYKLCSLSMHTWHDCFVSPILGPCPM